MVRSYPQGPMKDSLHILHLEDHEGDAELIRLRLVAAFGAGCTVQRVKSAGEFAAALDGGPFDLVISDGAVTGIDGLSALRLSREKYREVPFIFVCGAPKSIQADRMIAAGATDYVEKSALGDLAQVIKRALRPHVSGTGAAEALTPPAERLIEVVQQLSLARKLETVQAIVRRAARELTGSDGATFVLRDGEFCHYADEDAISPLWKGERFPMTSCISGWAMLNRLPAVIEDIYADSRIPHDAYRPTFVKSLVMVPIRATAPIGAIGNYWATPHAATPGEIRLLQALADSTSIAMENIRLYSELEERVLQRTAELEAANHDLEAFSYSVSHDLRSPLAGISGFADLLQDDFGPVIGAVGKQYLDGIFSDVNRMGNLIDDLLMLAKVGKESIRRGTVDLAELARPIMLKLHASAPQRQVDWILPERLIVDGDPGLLRVALENLLANAWKYSSKQKRARIELSVVPSSQPQTIFVKDNGAGFNPKEAHKLFGVFQRLHSRDEFPGTGIGLTTVRRIIEKHGGRIWAEGAVNQGATFSFTLG